jgi:multidrug efflux pump subunit AcrA (membrane-fusion protein)
MYPASPFGGVVDKIFVKVGENVQSGTMLASISGFDQHAEVVVNVPENVAKNISAFEPSVLTIGNKEISMMPTYVSKDATNGVLYSVIYQLDDSFSPSLTNLSFVKVKLAIGVADTTNIDPFIPLDSVIQTQEESYVFIVDDKNIARVKKIKLGQIQGRYVEVLEGLPNDSQIILDRNVIEGDKVSVIR